jgi:ribonuclease P protein component
LGQPGEQPPGRDDIAQSTELPTVERLKKRADFLRAARGIRRVEGSVTLETCPTPAPAARPNALRVGFTASKKIGNAVTRNRAKRRLRAAASQLLPLLGRGGHDYVLVARGTTVGRPFPALLSDITTAMKAAHRKLDVKAGESHG